MKKTVEKNRRIFLKHILACTATVAGTTANARSANTMPEAKPNHLNEKLYHESESFKKYYETLQS